MAIEEAITAYAGTERRQHPRAGEISDEQVDGALKRLVREGEFGRDRHAMSTKILSLLSPAAALPASQPAQVEPMSDATPAGNEVVSETDPRLQPYKAQYDRRWPEAMRAQYPWATVRVRLLTDTIEGGGEPLLTAAEGLVEAVFFGMDAEGNPMFADGKEDPRDLPHCGRDYDPTRKQVRFKADKEGKQVPTGYEMFPYANQYDKGEEMLAFERFTGKPFVKSQDRCEVASWVESGENSSWPRYVTTNPYTREACGLNLAFVVYVPERGVRRLLRGQEA